MRKFAVAALVAVALPAAASPLSEVCGQLIGSQVTQCMSAAGGRWIDAGAVRVCGQLIGGQVIECVRAIAGKDFTPGETTDCGALIGGQVIECLGRMGRAHVDRRPPPPPPGYGPSMAEVRAEIAAAVEQIRAGDPGGAEMRLRRLLAAMR